MDLRTATRVAGLLGGACWLTHYALGGPPALYWAGLGLLGVVLLDLGTGLVGKSVLWLRAIVAIAVPLLVWSMLEAIDPGVDASLVDAVFGGAVLLLCVQQLVRRPRPGSADDASHRHRHQGERKHPRRDTGSHAR